MDKQDTLFFNDSTAAAGTGTCGTAVTVQPCDDSSFFKFFQIKCIEMYGCAMIAVHLENLIIIAIV